MLNPTKAAILDVDGTMYPGSLGMDLLRVIGEESASLRRSVDEVFQILGAYREGGLDYDSMAMSAYQSYASAITGVSEARLRALSIDVWARHKHTMFPFVGPLLSLLRKEGFIVLIISGSPQEVVDVLARDLDVLAWGATFEVSDGRYSGRSERRTSMIGKKLDVFREYMSTNEIDVAGSLAIGNSVSDECLFEVVGLPFMFQPTEELMKSITKKGMVYPIIGPDDALISIARSIGVKLEDDR